MSPPVAAPGNFEIGRVIQRLFSVLGRNLGPFLIASAALTGLPMLIVGLIQTAALAKNGAGFANPLASAGSFLLVLPITMISSAVLQAAVIQGTVTDLNGGRVSLADCLRTSLRLLLPLIAIGILVFIATTVGMIFLIVPGVIIALALCVAVPAEVVERVGIFESLSRSAELTRNHRGAIFGLFVLYFVAAFIIQLFGAFIAGFVGAATLGFERTNALIVTPLIQTANALIGAVGAASIYYELRNIKEGVGPAALAAIFD